MRNEIQVWLSIICETLQQSLTKALEILRRATTQFLNRTPALIREASQFYCFVYIVYITLTPIDFD